ncbi:hypothetical protein BHM03_00007577 [Ensete ventricosum]|nr:hypothetical protein BHM03_00007577 [Ensete ventricosum]
MTSSDLSLHNAASSDLSLSSALLTASSNPLLHKLPVVVSRSTPLLPSSTTIVHFATPSSLYRSRTFAATASTTVACKQPPSLLVAHAVAP